MCAAGGADVDGGEAVAVAGQGVDAGVRDVAAATHVQRSVQQFRHQ